MYYYEYPIKLQITMSPKYFRNGYLTAVSTSSGGAVSPLFYQWFWLSWNNGTVSAGKGDQVGNNTYIVFRDSTATLTDIVAHIGISTSPNSPSWWLFSGCYYSPRKYK